MEIIENFKQNYILTGADTLPGHYLLTQLADAESKSGNDPFFSKLTLLHCAGTEEDENAENLNYKDTCSLLESLAADSDRLPRCMVYLSSWQVYSPDAGEDVDESRPTFAWSEAGKTKARTELWLEKKCAALNITLTIVRPALMFGTGVEGSMLRLFNRVASGRYVHIRGNDAAMSAVTAYDVARAIIDLAGSPGIFNISDGRSHKWIDLAEAMSANIGARKRMPCLPSKWASVIYRYFGRIPAVHDMLSPESLDPVSRTLVLSNKKVKQFTGIEFFDTLDVIARTAKDYPYENR